MKCEIIMSPPSTLLKAPPSPGPPPPPAGAPGVKSASRLISKEPNEDAMTLPTSPTVTTAAAAAAVAAAASNSVNIGGSTSLHSDNNIFADEIDEPANTRGKRHPPPSFIGETQNHENGPQSYTRYETHSLPAGIADEDSHSYSSSIGGKSSIVVHTDAGAGPSNPGGGRPPPLFSGAPGITSSNLHGDRSGSSPFLGCPMFAVSAAQHGNSSSITTNAIRKFRDSSSESQTQLQPLVKQAHTQNSQSPTTASGRQRYYRPLGSPKASALDVIQSEPDCTCAAADRMMFCGNNVNSSSFCTAAPSNNCSTTTTEHPNKEPYTSDNNQHVSRGHSRDESSLQYSSAPCRYTPMPGPYGEKLLLQASATSTVLAESPEQTAHIPYYSTAASAAVNRRAGGGGGGKNKLRASAYTHQNCSSEPAVMLNRPLYDNPQSNQFVEGGSGSAGATTIAGAGLGSGNNDLSARALGSGHEGGGVVVSTHALQQEANETGTAGNPKDLMTSSGGVYRSTPIGGSDVHYHHAQVVYGNNRRGSSGASHQELARGESGCYNSAAGWVSNTTEGVMVREAAELTDRSSSGTCQMGSRVTAVPDDFRSTIQQIPLSSGQQQQQQVRADGLYHHSGGGGGTSALHHHPQYTSTLSNNNSSACSSPPPPSSQPYPSSSGAATIGIPNVKSVTQGGGGGSSGSIYGPSLGGNSNSTNSWVGGHGGGINSVPPTSSLYSSRTAAAEQMQWIHEESETCRVAESFLQEYYSALFRDPASIAPFYVDDAELMWLGKEADEDVVHRSGIEEIASFFSSDYAKRFRGVKTKINALHPQLSTMAPWAIVVFAKGYMWFLQNTRYSTNSTAGTASSYNQVPASFTHFVALKPAARVRPGEEPYYRIANEYFHFSGCELESNATRFGTDRHNADGVWLYPAPPPAITPACEAAAAAAAHTQAPPPLTASYGGGNYVVNEGGTGLPNAVVLSSSCGGATSTAATVSSYTHDECYSQRSMIHSKDALPANAYSGGMKQSSPSAAGGISNSVPAAAAVAGTPFCPLDGGGTPQDSRLLVASAYYSDSSDNKLGGRMAGGTPTGVDLRKLPRHKQQQQPPAFVEPDSTNNGVFLSPRSSLDPEATRGNLTSRERKPGRSVLMPSSLEDQQRISITEGSSNTTGAAAAVAESHGNSARSFVPPTGSAAVEPNSGGYRSQGRPKVTTGSSHLMQMALMSIRSENVGSSPVLSPKSQQSNNVVTAASSTGSGTAGGGAGGRIAASSFESPIMPPYDTKPRRQNDDGRDLSDGKEQQQQQQAQQHQYETEEGRSNQQAKLVGERGAVAAVSEVNQAISNSTSVRPPIQNHNVGHHWGMGGGPASSSVRRYTEGNGGGNRGSSSSWWKPRGETAPTSGSQNVVGGDTMYSKKYVRNAANQCCKVFAPEIPFELSDELVRDTLTELVKQRRVATAAAAAAGGGGAQITNKFPSTTAPECIEVRRVGQRCSRLITFDSPETASMILRISEEDPIEIQKLRIVLREHMNVANKNNNTFYTRNNKQQTNDAFRSAAGNNSGTANTEGRQSVLAGNKYQRFPMGGGGGGNTVYNRKRTSDTITTTAAPPTASGDYRPRQTRYNQKGGNYNNETKNATFQTNVDGVSVSSGTNNLLPEPQTAAAAAGGGGAPWSEQQQQQPKSAQSSAAAGAAAVGPEEATTAASAGEEKSANMKVSTTNMGRQQQLTQRPQQQQQQQQPTRANQQARGGGSGGGNSLYKSKNPQRRNKTNRRQPSTNT